MVLVPVILSGGAGTRLWPVSRQGHPKPFMKMPDGESLLEKAYLRAKRLLRLLPGQQSEKIVTVTNRDYYFMSRDELLKVGATGVFLLEPSARNTAAAVALAAEQVAARFGADAVMLVMPADHLILDEASFHATVAQAMLAVAENFLVTFGVPVTAPETGFGYIELGEAMFENVAKVERFVEKPALERAQQFVASGRFRWNAGIFLAKASTFLENIRQYAPEVAQTVEACSKQMMEMSASAEMVEIPEASFQKIPSTSFDCAVMEKAQRIAVATGSFDWCDVGSWSAIQNLLPADTFNNKVSGNAVLIGSENVFVNAESRLVAGIGLDNLMIIETADAVLVSPPERAQEVRQIVAVLEKSGSPLVDQHLTVMRPWGSYTVLEEGPGFKIKRIVVKPGGKLSLQSHQHRCEHWVVVSGEAVVSCDGQLKTLAVNESTYIPMGVRHRLENTQAEDLVMIEVQTGRLLSEADIERYEDSYGRS